MEKEREESAEFWRKALVEGEKPLRFIRSAFRRIPSSPRCKICLAPFANIGGRVLGLVGFAPSRKNPLFCNG
jgi:adenylate cyclase